MIERRTWFDRLGHLSCIQVPYPDAPTIFSSYGVTTVRRKATSLGRKRAVEYSNPVSCTSIPQPNIVSISRQKTFSVRRECQPTDGARVVTETANQVTRARVP